MQVSKEFDVIICGGGTSGVAAAIASARVGANTLLIERLGVLGGQMNVSGPPGFAYAHLFNARGEQVVKGIIEETHKRLLDAGHALPHLHPEFRASSGYTFSYVDPDWWGLMIFEMMTENKVNLLLHTLVVDVVKEGNAVKGVIVENASGREILFGKVVIDCTGEGDIAARAGAPYEIVPRDQIQPHSLSFTADGVNWENFLAYMRANPNEFELTHLIHPDTPWTKEMIANGYLNVKDITEIGEIMGFYSLRDAALAKGEWHQFSGVGFFFIPREGGVMQAHFQHSSQVPNCDPTNAWDLTHAEIECRRQITIAFKFFKKYVPGFENAYITRICPEIRIREGRRIMGDYILTSQDIGNCMKFPDVIGKSTFKAGGHHAATLTTLDFGAQRVWPKDGGSYDIPYRCLVPREVENLMVGGKMVSTDRDAYLRYLQQTMVTGQAAGAAAALCVKKGITPRQLEEDVKELQDILLQQGVVLYGTY
jgi:hypothetical protein